jgi:HTH-type transcriptional regulator / antitoxin HipB
MEEKYKMKNTVDFEELLNEKYGEKGTVARDKYNAESLAFRLGVMLKEARPKQKLLSNNLQKEPEPRKAISQGSRKVRAIFRFLLITS